MVTIHTRARVSTHGRLTLDVPTGLGNGPVDVLLVLQPVAESPDPRPSSSWPEGFIERTYGICADDPIALPPPLPDPVRDPIE